MGRGDDNRRYVLDREGTAGGHNLWFTSYGTPPIPDIYLMLVWVGGGVTHHASCTRASLSLCAPHVPPDLNPNLHPLILEPRLTHTYTHTHNHNPNPNPIPVPTPVPTPGRSNRQVLAVTRPVSRRDRGR